MEEIYNKIIEQVSNGAHCTVNFKKRTISVNGKFIKLKGCNISVGNFENLDDWLDEVENLYDDYKYSKPTIQSSKRERKAKFKALSSSQLIQELGHDALNSPIARNVAQAKLEVFILLSLVNGTFNPSELFAKDWFYQGSDKSLIIRKDWF